MHTFNLLIMKYYLTNIKPVIRLNLSSSQISGLFIPNNNNFNYLIYLIEEKFQIDVEIIAFLLRHVMKVSLDIRHTL